MHVWNQQTDLHEGDLIGLCCPQYYSERTATNRKSFVSRRQCGRCAMV